MLALTGEEQAILQGVEGPLRQLALKNIVRYGEILGAKELCPVTKATVFCGAHNYLKVLDSTDETEIFSKMNLLSGDNIVAFDQIDCNCYAQSCVSVCDRAEYAALGQSEALFAKNQRFLDMAQQAGVIVTGSCSPYLTGWLPVRGEHFVTTESSVTILGNSLWGACGNSDGIEAAFWSAICGRTPKWGKHLPENRFGTHLYRVTAKPQTITDWELMGRAIGKQLPSGAVPVVVGDFGFVDFNRIRYFMTTCSISSNCELCHLVGITPDAPTIEAAFGGHPCLGETTITQQDLAEAYASYCSPGEGSVDLVSLGCPHYDIHQIQQAAAYLKGKKVAPGVTLMLWTAYPIKHMADVNGYTAIIEEAGGHIYTGTCPTTIGACLLGNRQAIVMDSLKQIKSVHNEVDSPVYYGDMQHCLDAAVHGCWKEEYRWR